ncbi:MAG: hypothetical protein PHQ34_14260, partial [Methanothrix sp.]|nr:hypothetical protein [Methanothrix sp.]
MIIRILGEGQFKLDGKHLDALNKIDNQIVEHVSKGNKAEFHKDMAKLISIIKEKGEPLDPAMIISSDIIIPPGDMSIAEAKKVFCGQGLIEG